MLNWIEALLLNTKAERHDRQCVPSTSAILPPTLVDAARVQRLTTNAIPGNILETAGGTAATWSNGAPMLEFCFVAGRPTAVEHTADIFCLK